ncbi:MAG: YchE family NAAT transporter [Desulfobacteraceae bacterium]|nr:YchE family NAAT transporter [Desulfobacteraceae bacterium]
MLEYSEYTKMLIGLIAILNPVGAIPIFISLTSELDLSERSAVSKVVVYAVLIILLLSLFVGELVLNFFGITISSFRVAGGLLILLMAISMMHAKTSGAKHTAEEAEESEKKDSIAVVPLATPLLAGPGAISTVILYANKGTGLRHYSIIAIVILVTSTVLFTIFKFVPYISKYISQTGLNVFTRIMGLILASISIEFIASGIKGLFPTLM